MFKHTNYGGNRKYHKVKIICFNAYIDMPSATFLAVLNYIFGSFEGGILRTKLSAHLIHDHTS